MRSAVCEASIFKAYSARVIRIRAGSSLHKTVQSYSFFLEYTNIMPEKCKISAFCQSELAKSGRAGIRIQSGYNGLRGAIGQGGLESGHTQTPWSGAL